jgi:hypothetical protein
VVVIGATRRVSTLRTEFRGSGRPSRKTVDEE